MSFEKVQRSENKQVSVEGGKENREEIIKKIIQQEARKFFAESRYEAMQSPVLTIDAVTPEEFESLYREAQAIEDEPEKYTVRQIDWKYIANSEENLQILLLAYDGVVVEAKVVYSTLSPSDLPE